MSVVSICEQPHTACTRVVLTFVPAGLYLTFHLVLFSFRFASNRGSCVILPFCLFTACLSTFGVRCLRSEIAPLSLTRFLSSYHHTTKETLVTIDTGHLAKLRIKEMLHCRPIFLPSLFLLVHSHSGMPS